MEWIKFMFYGFAIGLAVADLFDRRYRKFIKRKYWNEITFRKELIKNLKIRINKIIANFENMDEYTFSKVGRKNIIKELNELIVILGENDENR